MKARRQTEPFGWLQLGMLDKVGPAAAGPLFHLRLIVTYVQ